MTNINVVPDFVLAGNATFTVSNTNGKHYTYNIYKAKPSERFPNPQYFAMVLIGSNPLNPDEFRYVGKLKVPPRTSTSSDPVVVLTQKSAFRADDERYKVLQWALKAIWQVHGNRYKLPATHTIQHIGRCGRCGAALTNPASLDTGLGPECAKFAGVDHRERSQQLPLPTTAEAVEKLREKHRARGAGGLRAALDKQEEKHDPVGGARSILDAITSEIKQFPFGDHDEDNPIPDPFNGTDD